MIVKRDLLPFVGNAKLPPKTSALSNDVQTLITAYLADNAESLQLLHKAASVRRCRYSVDLTTGFETPLPHLSGVRQGARLLALEGLLQSERGESAAASKAIQNGISLARSVEQEPLLISQLVRIACQGIALTGLERMLNRTTPTDTELLQIATAASDAEASEAMIRGFVGEISSYDAIFRMPVRKLTEWVGKGLLWLPIDTKKTYIVAPLIALYRATGLMEMDHLTLLRGIENYVDACRKPLPSRLRASESCRADAESLPCWHVLSRMFLPALSNSHVKEAEGVACLHISRLALTIERYRLANGELPDSLNDLVPKFLDVVPVDPFDGQPLRYKKLARGYVVYSIGKDRKDDGGVEVRQINGPGDITFTVER